MATEPKIFYTTFSVDGDAQTITLTGGGEIRASSKHYFKARFEFVGNDGGNAFLRLDHLTATFSPVPAERSRNGAYSVPLEETGGVYECEIPWEVLTRRGNVYVGVFAGDMLVTNEATIRVTKAAPVLGSHSQPTESWWSRFSAALAAAVASLTARINTKQDALLAGENITISGTTISADVPEPSNARPNGDSGRGDAGVSNEYARADHIHPITHDDTKQNAPYIVEFTQLVNGDIVTDHDPEDFLNAVYNPSAFEPFNADVELNTGRTLRLTRFCNDDWEWFYFSDVDVKPEQPSFAPQYGWTLRFQCDENGFHNIGLAYDGIATYASLDSKLDNDFGVENAGKVLGINAEGGVEPVAGGGSSVQPYTSDPAMDGVASAGSSDNYARGDHVHPSDTSKYTLPSGGIPKTDLASAVQTSLGKADTAYQLPSGGIPASDLASGVIPSVPSASSATPQALGTAAAGSSSDYSRADHVHKMPTAADVGAIAAPSSPATGAFLVYNGSAWAAQTLTTWQGGNY